MKKPIKRFAELEKELDSVNSAIDKLESIKISKERRDDSKVIDKEIKQIGKKPKLSFDQLLDQAYDHLKAGDIRKASEIYLELRNMYIELDHSMKKK